MTNDQKSNAETSSASPAGMSVTVPFETFKASVRHNVLPLVEELRRRQGQVVAPEKEKASAPAASLPSVSSPTTAVIPSKNAPSYSANIPIPTSKYIPFPTNGGQALTPEQYQSYYAQVNQANTEYWDQRWAHDEQCRLENEARQRLTQYR